MNSMRRFLGGKRIYCDAAGTTPIDRSIAFRMYKLSKKIVGNPSGIHKEGVSAKKILEFARGTVAKIVGVRHEEVIFTGSGTEANNIAIRGLYEALIASQYTPKNLSMVTTSIEHASVIEPVLYIQKQGVSVSFVPPKENGIVNETAVSKLIQPHTFLVSVMAANNEIGTIQPVDKIGVLVRKERERRMRAGETLPIVFHVDASQIPLYMSVSIEKLRADMMTLDGHKMHGPKGVGALVVRSWIPMRPILFGGSQEKGLRSGTEDILGAFGLSEALLLADKERDMASKRVRKVRDTLWALIQKNIPKAVLNGDIENRLPNNLHISIPGIDPEFTVIQLDAKGIAVSTKSSCKVHEDHSYVVKEISKDEWRAKNTIRFSFLKNATVGDAKRIARALTDIMSRK